MATSYTTLLGLALPVTGELSGTWGTTVNNSITELVEDAIAASATASVAAADWTLSTTGSGATNEARCAILIPTGSPGVSRNIVAPSASKAYIVVNQSNAAVVVKGAATTGISIPAATTALVAWNGSDFVLITGITGPSSATDNAFTRFDGATGKVIQNSTGATLSDTGAPTFTGSVSVAGTSASASSVVLAEDTDNGSNTVTLQAAASIASSFSLVLPSADGTANQVIKTDGSGNLSFTTPSAGISAGTSIALAMVMGG